MRSTVTLLVILSFAGKAALGRDWKRATSDHFELYTSASDTVARDTLKYFEQVRGFFVDALGIKPASPNRVRLIGFSSAKEYEPYRIRETAYAYYLPTADRDYIVMQSLGNHFFETAIHEYVHLLVEHSGAKLPMWANEGLADLYSTLTPRGKQVQMGAPPEGRAFVLSRENWLPLETVFRVTRDSPEYNERNRVGIFYSQSWALMHMVMLGKEWRDKAQPFMKALLGGRSGAEAFSDVYGKSLKQVSKDVREYVNDTTIAVALFDAKLAKDIDNIVVQKAPSGDADLVLGHVLNFTGRSAEALKLYSSVAEQYPNNVEAQESLGYAQLRLNNVAEASRYFARAGELGSRNARMYRDYASLISGDQPAAIGALKKSLALEPDFVEARYHLASLFMSAQMWGAAYSELAQVKTVKPDRALWFFRAMTYALLELNQFDDAEKTATRALTYAKSPNESAELRRLSEYIEQRRNAGREQTLAVAQPPPVIELTSSEVEDDQPPTLRRRLEERLSGGAWARDDENRERLKAVKDAVEVAGKLIEIECLGKEAKLHIVDTGGNKSALLIDDPALVHIKTKDEAASVELTCGPQERPVVIGYSPQENSTTRTQGIVRSIRFE